jgi:hypothetical protein
LKNGQKLKLGDAHAPQEISKRYKRQSLGMPLRHPLFIGKNQVTFQHAIFLLLHALCIFLGASVVFSFQFCLVLFAAIKGWTPINFFWRSCLAFHLPRTLRFSLLSFNEYSLFLELRLALFFALICVQILLYLCIKEYFDLLSMLVFIKRVVSKRFEWCWKREKKLCKKVVQE